MDYLATMHQMNIAGTGYGAQGALNAALLAALMDFYVVLGAKKHCWQLLQIDRSITTCWVCVGFVA